MIFFLNEENIIDILNNFMWVHILFLKEKRKGLKIDKIFGEIMDKKISKVNEN